MEDDKFIEELLKNPEARGDIQGAIEAYVMKTRHITATDILDYEAIQRKFLAETKELLRKYDERSEIKNGTN